MAANINPIFPVAPVVGIATLTAVAVITSRANIVGTTGLTQLTPVSTEGKRVDAIQIKGKGTTVASQLFVWIYDGTNSYLYDEITIDAITASDTVESFSFTRTYQNLVLPATYKLYISQTVQTDVTAFAFGGDY
jgi:hypothetical protein